MNVLVLTDFKACEKNGVLYVGTQFSTIVKRYRAYFGDVTLVARITPVRNIPSGHEDASEYIARYVSIPGLKGIFAIGFRTKMKELIELADFVVLRCPSVIAQASASMVLECGKPYMTELMGDAWDAYWNHGLLGKIIAPYMYLKMKKVVASGNYALYVTEKFLQARYPCKGITVAASNVLLDEVDDRILQKRIERIKNEDTYCVTLMTTGAVDVRYKGHEFVIKAIPRLNRVGIKVRYIIVGGGDKFFLQKLASKLKVSDQIVFSGRQPLDSVFALLDEVDIYVQPSLQEGLPRSVIEAMSRGCPVIGFDTAGIPELIDSKYVVGKKNVDGIVNIIKEIINMSTIDKIQLSKRNFEKSKEYTSEVLDNRRDCFFKQVISNIELL